MKKSKKKSTDVKRPSTPPSGKEKGNRKGGEKDVAEKELKELIGEKEGNALIDSIRTAALLEILGQCASMVQRDIRKVRSRNPITAELIEMIVADPVGFTFTAGGEALGITRQEARRRLWCISRTIPWLEALLAERMRMDNGRGTPCHGSF